jgi:Mg2+ and Co2+ transporter CorA
LCTLESVCAHHKLLIGKTPSMLEESTQRALEYRKTMFQSTQRRLESLEKRMQNIIQLSFHLETQRDSQSMKTVAVMMLIFTPLGTVAAIFGTQLIKIEDTTPYLMVVSQDFWLLWVVAIPLTIFVVAIWRGWHTYVVLQLKTLGENFEIAAKKRQKGARNMA